jgi:hypothetical protein
MQEEDFVRSEETVEIQVTTGIQFQDLGEISDKDVKEIEEEVKKDVSLDSKRVISIDDQQGVKFFHKGHMSSQLTERQTLHTYTNSRQ